MGGRKFLNLLREDIQSGSLGTHGQLPTLREMAQRYDCSVSSVRQAVGTLREEGLLQSRSGKGIFRGIIPQPGVASSTERNRIIGAVVLQDGLYCYLERCKKSWQERGWFIVAYQALKDLQDSAAERRFLELTFREKFVGVMINASPLPPLNTALYQEMRQRGMKVAHLSHYCPNMAGESFFLLDHVAAGRLCVGAALRRGREHVAMLLNNVTTPYMSDMVKGVEEMVNSLQLPVHAPIICEQWGPFPDDENIKRESVRKHLDELERLPEGTALLCSGPDMQRLSRQLLEEAGIMKRKKFLIFSLNNYASNGDEGDGAYFDLEKQLEVALEYITDASIDAQTIIQRYFAPEIRIADSENA